MKGDTRSLDYGSCTGVEDAKKCQRHPGLHWPRFVGSGFRAWGLGFRA